MGLWETSWASWASWTTRVGVCDATTLIYRCRGTHLVSRRTVDAEAQPRQQAVSDPLAQQHVLHDRVRRTGRSVQDRVPAVGGELLFVGRVRGLLFHFGDQVLVEIQLADVRSRRVEQGAISLSLGLEMDCDVDVGCSTCVVAGEDGMELNCAVGVGFLDPTEHGIVEVRFVLRAAPVACGGDTAVYTCSVAVCPVLNIGISSRGNSS